MSTPTEDAARQAAQQLAALLRAMVELARVLESARPRQPQQPANNTAARPQPAERYAAAIERTFGPQVRQALTRSPEWQRVVDQLAYLERAGIGAEQLLGTLATLTRPTVPQPNPTPTPPASEAQHYAQLVHQHVTDPAVAQALTTSPEWPRVAAQLHDLRLVGVDVPRLLTAVQPELSRIAGEIDTAWQRNAGPGPQQAAATQPQAPAPQEAAAAEDRQTALAQAGLSNQDNERMVRIAREAAPPGIGELLAASDKAWPQIAQRMYALEQQYIDPAARLGRIQQEMTAQAAAGQRPDAAAAALAALSKPAPAAATASTRRAPAAAERARTGPDVNLRRAAEIAVTNRGVTARMLMAEGRFSTKETGRLLTELRRHEIVGPRGESKMYPARVSSVSQALAIVDGRAQSERTAAAASATSTTASAPPRAGGPAPAAAATATETPVHTAGRRR